MRQCHRRRTDNQVGCKGITRGACDEMIAEGLNVLVFGMLGIFVVMGFIILSIILLTRFGKGKQESDD